MNANFLSSKPSLPYDESLTNGKKHTPDKHDRLSAGSKKMPLHAVPIYTYYEMFVSNHGFGYMGMCKNKFTSQEMSHGSSKT